MEGEIETYYTVVHFMEDPTFPESEDYDCKNILWSSYNYALTLIGEEEEKFFDEEEEEYSKCGYTYEPSEKFDEYFEDLWSKDVWVGHYYEMYKVSFHWIWTDVIDEFQELFFDELKRKSNFVWRFEDSRILEIRK